jgi:hypothetical protein
VSNATSATRSNYQWSLAKKWLRVNRPDVIEAAYQEAVKKFPSKRTREAGTTLPESLRNLK